MQSHFDEINLNAIKKKDVTDLLQQQEEYFDDDAREQLPKWLGENFYVTYIAVLFAFEMLGMSGAAVYLRETNESNVTKYDQATVAYASVGTGVGMAAFILLIMYAIRESYLYVLKMNASESYIQSFGLFGTNTLSEHEMKGDIPDALLDEYSDLLKDSSVGKYI